MLRGGLTTGGPGRVLDTLLEVSECLEVLDVFFLSLLPLKRFFFFFFFRFFRLLAIARLHSWRTGKG